MDGEETESTNVDNLDTSGEVATEPAEESYTVIVDGDEAEVSLSELRDGYQRQSDYTRKTQELASERKRLQQAEAIVSSLESDPAGTLTALQDAFGLTGTPAPVPTSPDPYSTDWDEEPTVDPNAERIANLEARLEMQDRVHRKEQVEKQVVALKQRYGDFDANELYQHALTHRIGNLEAALTHMQYGDVVSKAQKLEKEQERLEAKRDASVVEPAGSKQAGVSNAPPNQPNSLREAFAQAKKQLAS
tara:strand:+ start:154 stop:894 length:741 start_codon:yes stop_codon:yes gene_type:complete